MEISSPLSGLCFMSNELVRNICNFSASLLCLKQTENILAFFCSVESLGNYDSYTS